MFPPLNLNPCPLKISKRENAYWVWDDWRKKQIQITPEEWVRQHLLHDLVNNYHYPAQRITVEMPIQIHGLKRRCDAVVYNADGSPQMLIECKETAITLTSQIIHQIAQYNQNLKTKWLLISNGLTHYTLHIPRHLENMVIYEGLVDYVKINNEN